MKLRSIKSVRSNPNHMEVYIIFKYSSGVVNARSTRSPNGGALQRSHRLRAFATGERRVDAEISHVRTPRAAL